MARIEISLEEYNNLKKEIETLNNSIKKLNDENIICKEQNKLFKEILIDIIDGISFFERIFKWKYTIDKIKKNINYDKK